MEHPFRPLIAGWKAKIQKALEYKKRVFGDDAEEAMKFFHGENSLYERKGKAARAFTDDSDYIPETPSTTMVVNKVAELVAIYGPILYHKNPVRKVNPRKPPALDQVLAPLLQSDPGLMVLHEQMQMMHQQTDLVDQGRALLLEAYLNYTPTALNLKEESRLAITEALIKGLGILVHETYTPPGTDMMLVGSFCDSVDNWVFDPDATVFRDCKWVAQRCIHPVWEFERDYGLPPGRVRGNLESLNQQATIDATTKGQDERQRGKTNDLITYWKVYSKMGLGSRMGKQDGSVVMEGDKQESLEVFGDYCYLVLADELHYPANVPPELLEQPLEAIYQAVQWPTPFWADDAWPFTPIYFHPVPGCVFPMSTIRPALGELLFLQWCYSFLASQVKVRGRDFLAVRKSASEEILDIIQHGKDLTILKIEAQHGPLNEVVAFLNHPDFKQDIYTVLQAIETNFDKRTGLTELAYGMSSRQMRSATEAEVKADQLSVRPEDMSNRIEDAMTEAARKEAFMARWHLTSKDVAGPLGQAAAYWWDRLLASSDPGQILHNLEYRIEAGSAKKPNKAVQQENMQQAMQVLLQPLMDYAGATGDFNSLNALIQDWAKSIDLDASRYIFQPPPPPPQGPSPEEQQMQQEMALEQQRAEIDMAKGQQDMAITERKAQLEMMLKQIELDMQAQKDRQEMEHDEERFEQEQRQDEAEHKQSLAMQKEQSKAQVQATKAQAKARPASKNGAKKK